NALFSQVTYGFNTFNNGNDYLGWDENTTIPLEIRHDGGQPIIFSTGPNDEERMRILPNGRTLLGTTTNVGDALFSVVHNNYKSTGAFAGVFNFDSFTTNRAIILMGYGGLNESIGVLGRAFTQVTNQMIGVYGYAQDNNMN